MSLAYGIPSPLVNQPGAQVYSFVGTAITFSAGLAVSYAGLGIQNPATSKTKITVLKMGVAPTSAPAGVFPVGFGKLVAGTASMGTLAAMAGVITAPGVVGTATGVGSIFGTATVLNGTAAAGLNALNYTAMAGGIIGTGTGGTWIPAADLSGEATVMPGESGVLLSNAAITGIPYLVWVESPIQ